MKYKLLLPLCLLAFISCGRKKGHRIDQAMNDTLIARGWPKERIIIVK